MNKREFLEALEERMKGYDDIDVKGTLEYFSEMIEDRVEGGMTEEEAVKNLGSIEDMLMEIKKFLPAVVEGKDVGSGFQSLWIEDSSSDITFYPSKDESAHIECMESETVAYDVYVEEDTLYIKRQKEEKWYKRFLSFSLIKDVELKVYLPNLEYENLRIHTNRGDVEVGGFHFKRAEIKNMAGDVRLEGIGGEVELTCMAGDVKLIGGDYREIRAKLTAGDIKMQRGRAESVNIDCTNGDVKIAEFIAGDMRVKSVNGDIELQEVDAENYHLGNVSGDIEALLLTPKRIEASSVMGDVKGISDYYASGVFHAKTVMGDISVKVK